MMRFAPLLAALACLAALASLMAGASAHAEESAAKPADCSKAPNTAAMNACYGAARDAADATLNARYKTLMSRLGADDQARLREAQRAWIAFRDKQCAFETAAYSTGSIYPVLVATCVTELTVRRTETFEHYLDCPSGDTSCVPLTEAGAAARQPSPPQAAADNAPCRQTAGAAKAQQYAQQCMEVSPATHPPCNVQNACSLITNEIRRGCAMIGAGAPAFCASYKQ